MELRDWIAADLEQILYEKKQYERLRTDEDPPTMQMYSTRKGEHYRKVVTGNPAKAQTYHSKTLGSAADPEVQEIQANHFYNKALDVLEKDRKAAEFFLRNYEPHDPFSITEKLAPAYRPAPSGLWVPEEELRAGQYQRAAERVQARDERRARQEARFGHAGIGTHRIRTVTGELVRSRGEAIIYNALHALELPFVYEDTLWLEDGRGEMEAVSSDFRILIEPEVIWEHSGMFSETGCRKDVEHKIELYYLNGYTLGDTLIITMDDKDGMLNTQMLLRTAETLAAR